MKHIYVNLKRFDVPRSMGGVNEIAEISDWGGFIIDQVQDQLTPYGNIADFTFFLPEMHLLSAIRKRNMDGIAEIGCQGVYRQDVRVGGNFGAFTTSLPAAAAKAAGCNKVLIGHCEERTKLLGILEEAQAADEEAVNRILNCEVRAAVEQGMDVLYCIGEKSEQMDSWKEVLRGQLLTGLLGIPLEKIVIAYEPVWSIGPGKVPADKEYITKIARFIKETIPGIEVVYGGGLKQENAAMLASIEEIDGGLIALTRFSGDIGFYPDEYLEIVQLYLT